MDIVIEYINAYALKKVKQNTPLRRRSRFQNWKPVTKYEMIKFLATTMAMGLNKKINQKIIFRQMIFIIFHFTLKCYRGTGKNTSFDPNSDTDGEQAVQIFSTLLGVIGRGYHVFADGFYTTRKLVDYLLSEEK
ncbi:piggyBac transposable element-derived protein 4 [Biomphalaria glabrata]